MDLLTRSPPYRPTHRWPRKQLDRSSEGPGAGVGRWQGRYTDERTSQGAAGGYTLGVVNPEPSASAGQPRAGLVEFPADDPERARTFWSQVLAVELEPRTEGEGRGWQTHGDAPALGVHERGPGPGDRFGLV